MSFCFYLLGFFIKYLPGNIFINYLVSGFASLVLPFEGLLQGMLGTKLAQTVSFGSALVAIIVTTFFDKHTQYLVLYSLFLMVVKGGL